MSAAVDAVIGPRPVLPKLSNQLHMFRKVRFHDGESKWVRRASSKDSDGMVPTSNFDIPNTHMSKRQALIKFESGCFYVSDTGLRFGTILDGALVDSNPTRLYNNDILGFIIVKPSWVVAHARLTCVGPIRVKEQFDDPEIAVNFQVLICDDCLSLIAISREDIDYRPLGTGVDLPPTLGNKKPVLSKSLSMILCSREAESPATSSEPSSAGTTASQSSSVGVVRPYITPAEKCLAMPLPSDSETGTPLSVKWVSFLSSSSSSSPHASYPLYVPLVKAAGALSLAGQGNGVEAAAELPETALLDVDGSSTTERKASEGCDFVPYTQPVECDADVAQSCKRWTIHKADDQRNTGKCVRGTRDEGGIHAVSTDGARHCAGKRLGQSGSTKDEMHVIASQDSTIETSFEAGRLKKADDDGAEEPRGKKSVREKLSREGILFGSAITPAMARGARALFRPKGDADGARLFTVSARQRAAYNMNANCPEGKAPQSRDDSNGDTSCLDSDADCMHVTFGAAELDLGTAPSAGPFGLENEDESSVYVTKELAEEGGAASLYSDDDSRMSCGDVNDCDSNQDESDDDVSSEDATDDGACGEDIHIDAESDVVSGDGAHGEESNTDSASEDSDEGGRSDDSNIDAPSDVNDSSENSDSDLSSDSFSDLSSLEEINLTMFSEDDSGFDLSSGSGLSSLLECDSSSDDSGSESTLDDGECEFETKPEAFAFVPSAPSAGDEPCLAVPKLFRNSRSIAEPFGFIPTCSRKRCRHDDLEDEIKGADTTGPPVKRHKLKSWLRTASAEVFKGILYVAATLGALGVYGYSKSVPVHEYPPAGAIV